MKDKIHKRLRESKRWNYEKQKPAMPAFAHEEAIGFCPYILINYIINGAHGGSNLFMR